MSYTNIIGTADAQHLIPASQSRELIKALPQSSIFMHMARRLANMPSRTYSMPVMNALATAYFVNGDTGYKQTSKLAWANKVITAEEIAVIVPVPDNVISDSAYDIWGEVRPALIEAAGVLIDRAVFHGESAPATWPQGIIAGAIAAGNVITQGTGETADLYGELFATDGLFDLTSKSGFRSSGIVANIGVEAALDSLRDTVGQPIFRENMVAPGTYRLKGRELVFAQNGALTNEDNAIMISGAWEQAVYAVREDIRFELFKEGVITDSNGQVVLNLMQQGCKAIRMVMRLGWQLPNPINRVNQSATRYPFAVMVKA